VSLGYRIEYPSAVIIIIQPELFSAFTKKN